MENINKIKEEILNRELKKQVERKTLLLLQISLQEKLSPDEISARKPLRLNQNGQPISFQEITRREHIEILRKELDDVNLILETIKDAFNN